MIFISPPSALYIYFGLNHGEEAILKCCMLCHIHRNVTPVVMMSLFRLMLMFVFLWFSLVPFSVGFSIS